METTKPFEISKHAVVHAWELVKANDGAEGVDGETIEQFAFKLKGNLYTLWNRLSSGSYFPPPTRTSFPCVSLITELVPFAQIHHCRTRTQRG